MVFRPSHIVRQFIIPIIKMQLTLISSQIKKILPQIIQLFKQSVLATEVIENLDVAHPIIRAALQFNFLAMLGRTILSKFVPRSDSEVKSSIKQQ